MAANLWVTTHLEIEELCDALARALGLPEFTFDSEGVARQETGG